jgi:hypothetical protein
MNISEVAETGAVTGASTDAAPGSFDSEAFSDEPEVFAGAFFVGAFLAGARLAAGFLAGASLSTVASTIVSIDSASIFPTGFLARVARTVFSAGAFVSLFTISGVLQAAYFLGHTHQPIRRKSLLLTFANNQNYVRATLLFAIAAARWVLSEYNSQVLVKSSSNQVWPASTSLSMTLCPRIVTHGAWHT